MDLSFDRASDVENPMPSHRPLEFSLSPDLSHEASPVSEPVSEDEDSKQFCANLVDPNYKRLKLADIDETPLDKREMFSDSFEERTGVG